VTVELLDTSLRDGMHAVGNSFSVAQVTEVSRALDRAGVSFIEVSHGAGLGGSSLQFGFAPATDSEYVEAAASVSEQAKVAVLLLPGIGTIEMLKSARASGAGVVRVATHCTEADLAAQHLSWAREDGIATVGFLMMSHLLEPADLADQAALMESYGAEVVYVVDSAGAMAPGGARRRVAALRERIDVAIGFHAHNNLGCAVGNSIAAVEAGATVLDGSLCGLGAGSGNAQTEVLAAALMREGQAVDVDLVKLIDAAEQTVAPLVPRPLVIDGAALMLGYAGVYSTFLEDAERAGEKYGVDPRDILVEVGHQGVRGGEEHLIDKIAAGLTGAVELG
jgi:4-hydroxy 2-oxovalerate aldolase